MTYNYRGFEIENTGAVFVIRENGRIIDDAANDVKAEDKINVILLKRGEEDQRDKLCPYGR